MPPKEYSPRRILIPFAGSGSEVIGAMLSGWEEIIGVEKEEKYVEIAKKRISFWKGKKVSVQKDIKFVVNKCKEISKAVNIKNFIGRK